MTAHAPSKMTNCHSDHHSAKKQSN